MSDSAIRSLLVEADSFISHMRHRGSWPGDEHEVDSLIGRLRRASEQMPAAVERERLPSGTLCDLIGEAETLHARTALLLAYYLDSDDPAVAEAFVHAYPAREE